MYRQGVPGYFRVFFPMPFLGMPFGEDRARHRQIRDNMNFSILLPVFFSYFLGSGLFMAEAGRCAVARSNGYLIVSTLPSWKLVFSRLFHPFSPFVTLFQRAQGYAWEIKKRRERGHFLAISSSLLLKPPNS